jgi:hypothetical protein
MSTLAELAQRFAVAERPAGNLLDETALLAQLAAAARLYAGFGALRSRPDTGGLPDIGAATDLSDSEWALIRPLFLLYVERETALQLEASRVMGADPFGRSSSEIAAEITQAETDMAHKAFCRPIVTV